MNNTDEKKYCDPIKKIKFSKNHLSQIKEIAEAIIQTVDKRRLELVI